MKNDPAECTLKTGDIIECNKCELSFILSIGRNTSNGLVYRVFKLTHENVQRFIDNQFNNVHVGFGHEQYVQTVEDNHTRVDTMYKRFPKIGAMDERKSQKHAIQLAEKRIAHLNRVIEAIEIVERDDYKVVSI